MGGLYRPITLSHLFGESIVAIDSSVKSLFATFQNQFESVQADQGHGGLGWWPEAGDHEVFVTGMKVEQSGFRQSDGMELPGVMVQFTYQLVEDATSPEEPRQFQGSPIRVPADASKITQDGSKIKAEIETKRLKGHLETILGHTSDNPEVALMEADTAINGDTPIAVMCRCQYNTRGTRTYKTEYLTQRLSS